MMKFKEIAQEIQNKVLSELKSQSSSDLSMTLDDYVVLRTDEIIKELVLSGKFNTEIQKNIENRFNNYVISIEYDVFSIKEHFKNFIENEVGNININFIRRGKKLKVVVRIPQSIFGAISTWASAILAARKILSKNPNKYPIRASYYWRKKVYPTDKLDETMALRLSFTYGYAPYVRMIESGTNIKLSSSYGGFPTPSYTGRRSFTQIMRKEIEEVINSFIDKEYNNIINKILEEFDIDLSRFPLTKKLGQILSEIAQEEVLKIINEIKTEGDTKKVLSVIIKIGKDYYKIIRTKKGNWGLRFDISRYRRRRR